MLDNSFVVPEPARRRAARASAPVVPATFSAEIADRFSENGARACGRCPVFDVQFFHEPEEHYHVSHRRLEQTVDERPVAARSPLRLRPDLMALEGRTLLSTFTVTSTADNGIAGTLRWAIGQANANRKADTIVFSNLFDSPQTINLSGKQLTLSGPARITITGPGENLLTVSGNNSSRVFRITSGASASLSGLTITGGSVNGNGGGVENTGGKLVLKNVVLTGNSARRGGGLFNDGATILSDVVTNGNTARVGSGLASTRSATLTRRGLSGPAATGPILSQTFNGTNFPSGWQQFLPGVVAESPHTFLTITDSTGMSAGIAANATKTVPFTPLGVVTTMTAQISSVSSTPQLGNAVFGLLGKEGPRWRGNWRQESMLREPSSSSCTTRPRR